MSSHQLSIEARILQQCFGADRPALLRRSKKALRDKSKPEIKSGLESAITESIEKVSLRRRQRPSANFNPNLPFVSHRDELAEAISKHQVVIVCGETGSGKTTQLPQLCIELGLADLGLIGHTQPRRIAAQSVAARIAEEIKTEVGAAVGYKIRFKDRSSPSSYIKLMTDGILLAETQTDHFLNQYSTIIIDEAHERSLNIDLLLGFVKQLLPKRPDLKLIVTSATIDPARFSRYFDDAPILNISGRSYPVEIRYRPPAESERDNDFQNQLTAAVDELDHVGREDILVFFASERQIRDAAERLAKSHGRHYDILPLYSRLSPREQKKIFQKHQKRRIVLATNVAETSLTVPGIRYVIDTGVARLSRYSWRARIQRLPIEKISQASANQRSGRCGRQAPGICIRLYDEEDFANRAEFTEPEILRSNLASVILQMSDLKLGSIHSFDFVESPDSRLINDGFRLLFELGATDKEDRILDHGHQITRLPIDPRLAHMLIRASQFNCLSEILIIVSALSIQDPRSSTSENRQAADEKYKEWQHEKSDFMFWVKLWLDIEKNQAELSKNQFSNWCRKHYLSYLRLREWQDIHRQLKQQLLQQKFHFNRHEADFDLIHRCIFSGIPSHIASYDKDKSFQGTRGRQLMIFPGSSLARQTPKWMMAFALIETSQLFAHGVARLDPQWVMQDAQHLHQYEYYEPHWQPRRGRVAAFRNTRVYGLLVEAGKKINFAAIDPKQSRQIFIQAALVEGDYRTRVEVINANRKLIEHYQQQEDKFRRRDILISDELLYQFYDARLPAQAIDAPSFEAWLKKQSKAQIADLRFLAADIVDQSIEGHQREGFPDHLLVRGQNLALEYRFEPGHDFDGVTVRLPLVLLNQFRETDFTWLVPGLLKEKIEALIKSLPRKLRKNFIPVSEFAEACLHRMVPEDSLYLELQKALQAMTGVEVPVELWQQASLDTHLNAHFALYDGQQYIAQAHDLDTLQNRYSNQAQQQFGEQIQQNQDITRSGLSDWNFDSLASFVNIKQGDQTIRAYPALVDYENSVSIELFETEADASFYHATGLARLYYLQLSDSIKYLHKNLPDIEQTALMYSAMGSRSELIQDVLMASIFDCFLSRALPQNRQQFLERLAQNRGEFIHQANTLSGLVHQILQLGRQQREILESANLPPQHTEDMKIQLDQLIYPGFVVDIRIAQLKRLPAYLQAMKKRCQNFKADSKHIENRLLLIQRYQHRYLQLAENENVNFEALDQLRWFIEEFRIASFAQPMKTLAPVSETKIGRLLEKIDQPL